MSLKPEFNKSFFKSRAFFKAKVRKPEELLTVVSVPDFILNRYAIDGDTEVSMGLYNREENFVVDSVTMRDMELGSTFNRNFKFESDLEGGMYQVMLKKDSNRDDLTDDIKYFPIDRFINRVVTRRNLKEGKHRGNTIRYIPVADEESSMVGLENEQDLRLIVMNMESSIIPKKDISVYRSKYFTKFGGIIPLKFRLTEIRDLDSGTDVTAIAAPVD